MKVLIDTNILISAALNPKSVTAKAYFKATELPYECVICDYCIDEFNRTFREKLANRIADANAFLAMVLISAPIISTPSDDESVADEAALRDINDWPIIRAAVKANVDIILTGDKNFLESKIKKPKMISPADFLKNK